MTACQIRVDMAKCSGLGLCEAHAPDHFEIGADGHLVVLREDVNGDERAEVEEAARSCPTQAITVEG